MRRDRPPSIAKTLTFSACNDESDFEAVLELRRRAYSAVGKVAATTKASEMADCYDHGAVIIMARDGDTLVATVRLMLPSPDERREFDDFLSLPTWIPRSQLGVISRLATHSEYRGGDLAYAMVLASLALAASHSRAVVASGCTETLLPIYARVGARGMGLRFFHAALASTPHELIVFRPESVMQGRGVRDDLAQSLLAFVQALAGQPQLNRRFRT